MQLWFHVLTRFNDITIQDGKTMHKSIFCLVQNIFTLMFSWNGEMSWMQRVNSFF
eukprot:c51888_g1_i1 orf=75-239(+)